MSEVYDDKGNLIPNKEVYDDNGNLVTGPSEESQEGILSKAYQFMMTPLLKSSIDESRDQTENYIGGDTPIIRDIWPGGIRVPNLKDIYEEIIRPMSSPLGLGTLGLEGAIGAKGYAKPKNLGTQMEPVPEAVPRQQYALPPASESALNSPKFIAGPSTIFGDSTYKGSGQVAPANASPEVAAHIAGMTGERSRGYSGVGGSGFDTGVLREQQRQEGLNYGPEAQYPGTRMTITDKGYQLPSRSGETRGGFSAESPNEQPWPYNVVPNSLRPRTAQSDVLGTSGLRDVDLSTPVESGSDIHFVSGGIENPEFIDVPPPDYNVSSGGKYELPSASPNQNMGIREMFKRFLNETKGEMDPDTMNRFMIKVGETFGKEAWFAAARTELDRGNSQGAFKLLSENLNKIEQPIKKPLDVINSSPKVAIAPSDINKIPPGQADVVPIVVKQGKNISLFRSETSSPHVVMENFPQSKAIIDPIMKANDIKYKWLATTMREFAAPLKGLSKEDRTSIMMMLNGEEVPGASPVLVSKAEQLKGMLDNVWKLANDKNPEGVGFIDRYITHIKAQPDDWKSVTKQIWDFHFGPESGIRQLFSSEPSGSGGTGEIGDFYEKGLGKPTSSFTKTRTGALQDIETDPNKIIPIYLESMAKVIHDRPAVDIAKEALKGIPQGTLKEWLAGYIKNYTRYDADAELAAKANALANQIATINAHSVIAFNPIVHMYHLGQLPANVWPELGTKYSTIGLGKFLKNPVAGYQELAENGVFSGMIRPMQFQTKMQKFESVSYFMNYVESIVKGTGYYGFKQKALDSGMGETEAVLDAIQKTKNATATVDPARYMRYFTPESNFVGGQVARLGKQYHQIPYKLVEQFVRAAADFKANPAKAARYIAGTGIAGLGTAAGMHTLHVSPVSLAQYALGGAGQFGTVMAGMYRKLAKGDVGGALGDIATWITPGGATISKGIAIGNE